MQTLKTLVLTKSAAAALVAMSALSAPTLSHASPDDGMVCRAANGYSAQVANGNVKCVKTIVRTISGAFECLDSRFPDKVIRVAVPGDTSGGRDLCTRRDIVITSNSPLTGLIAGTHFQFATVNQAKVVATREAAERAEELALGLGLDGVDSRSSSTVVVNANSFGEDVVRATITLFTFAIPAPNQILLPIQLDPRPLNLPTLSL